MRFRGRARLPALSLACLLFIFAFVSVAAADLGPLDPAPAPDTVLDDRPAALTSLRSASFAFHSDVPEAPFECALDGADYVPCVSPVNIPMLSLGLHIFSVRAVGDLTAAVFAWEVLAIPDTAIDTGPDSPTTAGTAAFAFHASTLVASFECALDEGAWVLCSSGYEVSSLSVGSHVMAVRAVNAAHDPDPTPAEYRWEVLTPPPGAPDTEILDQPQVVTPSTAVAFVFRSTTAGVTFECRLDDLAWGPCDPLPSVGAGPHVFAVRALNAGTPDPTPAEYRWTVVPPDTIIDSTPASPTTASGAVFTFHASTTPATYQCARDGADFSACVSGQILTGLGVGLHHFEVRARNAAGDLDPTPAVAEWLVVAPAGSPGVGGTGDGGGATATPTRPTLSPTPAPTPTTVVASDPCAGRKPRALKLCRADQSLKAALKRCGKLKSSKSRSRCTKKARAVRTCANLSGRKERTCRTKAAKLRGS